MFLAAWVLPTVRLFCQLFAAALALVWRLFAYLSAKDLVMKLMVTHYILQRATMY
jgi:hypothetical protein